MDIIVERINHCTLKFIIPRTRDRRLSEMTVRYKSYIDTRFTIHSCGGLRSIKWDGLTKTFHSSPTAVLVMVVHDIPAMKWIISNFPTVDISEALCDASMHGKDHIITLLDAFKTFSVKPADANIMFLKSLRTKNIDNVIYCSKLITRKNIYVGYVPVPVIKFIIQHANFIHDTLKKLMVFSERFLIGISGKLQLIQKALELHERQVIKINISDLDQFLYDIVGGGNLDVIKIFIQKYLPLPNNTYWRLLKSACSTGKTEIIGFIIQSTGVNPVAYDLTYACSSVQTYDMIHGLSAQDTQDDKFSDICQDVAHSAFSYGNSDLGIKLLNEMRGNFLSEMSFYLCKNVDFNRYILTYITRDSDTINLIYRRARHAGNKEVLKIIGPWMPEITRPHETDYDSVIIDSMIGRVRVLRTAIHKVIRTREADMSSCRLALSYLVNRKLMMLIDKICPGQE